MSMWIYRNGQSLGSFEESIVENNLRNGSFFPTDVACREGENQQYPLYSLFPQIIPQQIHPISGQSKANKKGIVLSVLGVLLLILGIAFLVWSKVVIASQQQEFARSGEFGRVQEGSSIMSALDTFGYVTGAIGLTILVVSLLQKGSKSNDNEHKV